MPPVPFFQTPATTKSGAGDGVLPGQVRARAAARGAVAQRRRRPGMREVSTAAAAWES
jgi:hypothetical protein